VATLTVPRNDKGYYLNFTVQYADGTAFNLTGYTIGVKVWAPGRPDNPVLSGTGAIVVAASGTCKYLITATDFPNAGLYNLELELTQSGVIESTRSYILEVSESG
jgi:hypothetical protein